MISLGYFIQNHDTNKFWAGDCLWGELEYKTNKWNGPRLSEDIYPISGDGIQIYQLKRNSTPYCFETVEKAIEASRYVPRCYNFSVVEVKSSQSIIGSSYIVNKGLEIQFS